MPIHRPRFPVLASALVTAFLSAFGSPARAQSDLTWHDPTASPTRMTLEGKAFAKTAGPYDRLPARAKATVRKPVWDLSRHSAGICVRFRSDAREIWARWTLTHKALAMPHMPATGCSGVDLYVKHEGRWRWLAIGIPREFPENQARLVRGLPKGERDFLLYLPLFNGIAKLGIGIPATAKIRPGTAPKNRKPIVFYGTSITHGGCASRPGTCHTALVGRELDHPVVNLGFSGNGTMDAAVAELLVEIDAAVYIIDCLPNMRARQVKARTAPLVAILRRRRPDTPILLVEDRSYSDAFLLAGRAEHNDRNRQALRTQFEALKTKGTKSLFYLPGADLLGDDSAGTVDGSHPTDLGFARQAKAFTTKLRTIL